MSENPQAGLKDRNMQKYYEELIATFGTPGWEFFTEDLGRLFEVANSLDGVDTQRDLDYRRGQRDLLRIIISQPEVVRAAYENALEEDNG